MSISNTDGNMITPQLSSKQSVITFSYTERGRQTDIQTETESYRDRQTETENRGVHIKH